MHKVHGKPVCGTELEELCLFYFVIFAMYSLVLNEHLLLHDIIASGLIAAATYEAITAGNSHEEMQWLYTVPR